MNHTSDIHVIGGGLGGLAAAAFVARAGHPVTLHESRGRVGGRATTDDRSGFRFNQGPHALYRGGPAEGVLRRLGIRPDGRTPPTSGARALLGGALHLLPVGAASMLRSSMLGVRDKAEVGRLLTRLPRFEPRSHAEQTVAELVDDVVSRPRAREVVHALIRLASYADLPDDLSAEVALVQLQLAVRNGVSYLRGGWEQLVEELAAAAGVRFEPGARLEELPDAPAVIVATGSPASAAALTGHPYDEGVPADASVLDLGLDRPPAHDFVLGIDEPVYLSNHGRDVGVPDGRHSVSLAAYLGRDADAVDQAVLHDVARRTGIADDAIVEERYLRRMTVVSAVATAAGGGLAGRPGVAVPDRPGVFIVGDWVGPSGHLVDAVLASAEEAARAAVAHLSRRPTLR